MGIGPSVEFKRRKRKVILWRICGAAAILVAIFGGYVLLTRARYKITGARAGIGSAIYRLADGSALAEDPRRNEPKRSIMDSFK
jgi:hypothetical protein